MEFNRSPSTCSEFHKGTVKRKHVTCREEEHPQNDGDASCCGKTKLSPKTCKGGGVTLRSSKSLLPLPLEDVYSDKQTLYDSYLKKLFAAHSKAFGCAMEHINSNINEESSTSSQQMQPKNNDSELMSENCNEGSSTSNQQMQPISNDTAQISANFNEGCSTSLRQLQPPSNKGSQEEEKKGRKEENMLKCCVNVCDKKTSFDSSCKATVSQGDNATIATPQCILVTDTNSRQSKRKKRKRSESIVRKGLKRRDAEIKIQSLQPTPAPSLTHPTSSLSNITSHNLQQNSNNEVLNIVKDVLNIVKDFWDSYYRHAIPSDKYFSFVSADDAYRHFSSVSQIRVTNHQFDHYTKLSGVQYTSTTHRYKMVALPPTPTPLPTRPTSPSNTKSHNPQHNNKNELLNLVKDFWDSHYRHPVPSDKSSLLVNTQDAYDHFSTTSRMSINRSQFCYYSRLSGVQSTSTTRQYKMVSRLKDLE